MYTVALPASLPPGVGLGRGRGSVWNQKVSSAKGLLPVAFGNLNIYVWSPVLRQEEAQAAYTGWRCDIAR